MWLNMCKASKNSLSFSWLIITFHNEWKKSNLARQSLIVTFSGHWNTNTKLCLNGFICLIYFQWLFTNETNKKKLCRQIPLKKKKKKVTLSVTALTTVFSLFFFSHGALQREGRWDDTGGSLSSAHLWAGWECTGMVPKEVKSWRAYIYVPCV